ncbi:MAG: hypothetical protein RL199_1586 [Pseudomonadota bacterium]|jgi:hypothetical protein
MKLPALVLACLVAAGCHEDVTTGGAVPDEYVVDCEGAAAGDTFTSDESWASFVNAHAAGAVTTDACLAPQVSQPSVGDVLDPDAPPRFVFAPSCRTALDVPGFRGHCPPREAWWTHALGLLLLERPALAHCPAVSGTNYWLKLSTSAGEVVYSAVSSVTSFTPDAVKWKAKIAPHRGHALVLVVERAEFSKGDLQTGPFAPPQGVALSVKP